MRVHYCRECGWHSLLPDGVFCQWCLDVFYGLHPERTTVERLWAEIDAMEPALTVIH